MAQGVLCAESASVAAAIPKNDEIVPTARLSGAATDFAVHLALRIDNYSQIAAVFGDRTAERVRAAVYDTLRSVGTGNATRVAVLPDGADQFKFMARSPESGVNQAAYEVCVRIATTPICCGKYLVTPAISVGVPNETLRVEDPERDALLLRSAVGSLAELEVKGRAASRAALLMSDMEQAGHLLQLTRPIFSLDWKPVRNAFGDGLTLYDEAVPRFSELEDGASIDESSYSALDRVGCRQAFDSLLANHAIEQTHEEMLGYIAVPISASSAYRGYWWDRTFSLLAARPRASKKIIFRIHNRGLDVPGDEILAFTEQLRSNGCLVAISGFGSDTLPIDQIAKVQPDIIELSDTVLQSEYVTRRDRGIAHALLELATKIAGTVIVNAAEPINYQHIAPGLGQCWHTSHLFHPLHDREADRDAGLPRRILASRECRPVRSPSWLRVSAND